MASIPNDVKAKIIAEAVGYKSDYAAATALAPKYGYPEKTVSNMLWYQRNGPKARSKKTILDNSYTDMDYLEVGDRAVVKDAADAKHNGLEITITKVGPVFVEGITDKGKDVAAYKVKKINIVTASSVNMPLLEVSDPKMPAPPIPAQLDTPIISSSGGGGMSDEIIWEKKLTYDVQTSNHFYKVKIEKRSVIINDSDDNSIELNRDRINDISLILSSIPDLGGDE